MFDRASPRPGDAARAVLPKDPALFTHLPYLIEHDDEVVRTRQNGLMMSLEIAGIDGMTAAPQDITDLRRAVATLIDGLDERFTFYIHRLHRPAALGLKPVHGDSFAADLDRRWRQHLGGQNLHDVVLVLTVVCALPTPLKVPLLRRAAARIFEADTETRLQDLRELIAIIETGLPNVTTRRLRISDGSLIGFYSAIGTGILAPAWRGEMTLIAEDAASSAATFFPDRILFDEGSGKPRHAAVLAIRRYSQETWPGMLDALDTSIDTLVTHSFTPIASEKIADRVRLRVNQMRAADDLATTIQQQLIETADAVESGGKSVGNHQLTITVFADSPAALDAQVSKVKGMAERARIKLTRCSHSLEASYFATHPGNMDYECWGMAVATTTFADMASLHVCDAGTQAQDLYWRTPVTVFQSATGAPHRFSFQVPGSAAKEPPLGHTLVLGPSDSGKTTTVAFLAAQAQRVRPRIIIFDKDLGLRSLVAALGGDYAQIRAGQATGLNPLLTETGPRGEAWLMDWLSALLERRGPLSPIQSAALKAAIRRVSAAPEALRSFEHFETLVGDVQDGRELAMRVAEWGPGGRYNWVFGAAKHPVVDFRRSDVVGLDMTEILEHATERTAILSYIFRRLELMFEERVPTLLIVDEAHAALDDDFFATRMPKWAVTARKLNVTLILMTQFPSQIEKSKARTILEGLPHRLIFPNSQAIEAHYANLHLTENQLGFVLEGQFGPRRALWNGPTGSTLLDVDLSPLGPLLTALSGGKAALQAFGEGFETRPNFWRTADV
ncbi:hypothetical protein [Paracoccus laeviglucosivorans]|uniref:Type IV secretion system protein VirB4 n=1 Tax=Paracoccus laeviglucosivorans TaxID=1197861 RepID=A0A521FSV1_9RHOB|nr:hypothetical protein [Paracoccus laeviglucosivorans]SMO99206.1 type IV secretion system protein VirB4 [Paracoccus laeviglucosivorans]